jgi:hypothetical protein
MAEDAAIVATPRATASPKTRRSGLMRKIVPKEKLAHMENLI